MPKSYNFYCFGCGRNTDIIDAFMHTRLSYIESVKKLFDLAGIKYSFGEHGVKTKHQYRYPKEVICDNKDRVYEYFKTRKISKETVDYLDVRQDEDGNAVFNFYDCNDVLTMVKYKPTHKLKKGETKTWAQTGADTTPLLFNMNRINTLNPLLIVEGEPDNMAAIECGFINTVSVPFGSNNFHWIQENWDWLEQFNSVIVCSDNDDPGIKMQKEVVYRLGSWRTKIVDIPTTIQKGQKTVSVKDLNEYLYYCGKEETLNLILNAKDSPIESLVDFADIDDIDLSDIDGIYTNIDKLDNEIMKMFYGSVTLLTGTPGSGKTSVLYQLACQALDQEKYGWIFSRELPSYMTRNWINYIFAGTRNVNTYKSANDTEYYKVKQETKKQIGEHYRGKLFIYKDGWSNSVEDIQQSMIDSARKNGSKLFIIDNLLTVNLHSTDENKYDKQTEFINWLIDFSTKYNVCTIIVCHPKKILETYNAISKYDIGGSSNMINLAHRSLGLRRVTKKEKAGIPNKNGKGWEVEPTKYDVIITVIKDRLRGREGFEIGMYYDIPSRRFFSNPKEYDWKYGWDTNFYNDKIPYPIDENEADEIFGYTQD